MKSNSQNLNGVSQENSSGSYSLSLSLSLASGDESNLATNSSTNSQNKNSAVNSHSNLNQANSQNPNSALNSSQNSQNLAPNLPTNLITNEPRNTLADKLAALFESADALDGEFSAQNKAKISIISAYFNAAAFEFLAKFSDKIAHFELIVGKDAPSASQNELLFYLKNDEIEIKDYESQLNAYATAHGAANFIHKFGRIFKLKESENGGIFAQNEIKSAQNSQFLGRNSQNSVQVLPQNSQNQISAQNSLNLDKNSRPNSQNLLNLATNSATKSKKQRLLHAKLYLLRGANKAPNHAIIGSSNFTASGLGLYERGSNIELNLLCDSKSDIRECAEFFNHLKTQCEDATDEVIANIDTAAFYRAPRDIVLKVNEHYDDLKDAKEAAKLGKMAKLFGLYAFQKRAVNEIYKRLQKYSVAMLADPVGAGKTLSALAVAGEFESVAIIVPPRLKAQWESYFNSENLSQNQQKDLNDLHIKTRIFSYHEAQSQNAMTRQFLQLAKLIIIDESHNFRNKGKEYQKLKENLTKHRQENPAKLLLLTATPINNGYMDLASQLGLIQDSLYIGGKNININHTCKVMCDERGLSEDYIALTHSIFARSAEEVAGFLKAEGVKMPATKIYPHAISSVPAEFSTKKFDFTRLYKLLGISDNEQKSKAAISFCIYDPYEYLPKSVQIQYESKLKNLGEYATPVGFLRMSLMKGLESSVEAFLSTITHIISYYEKALNTTDSGSLFYENDSDESDDKAHLPYRYKELKDNGLLSKLNDEFYEHLRKDLAKLQEIKTLFNYYKQADLKSASLLLESANKANFASNFAPTSIAKSEKFTKLLSIIRGENSTENDTKNSDTKSVGERKNEAPKKLLIFTESALTAKAIFVNLQAEFKGEKHIGLICGELNSAAFNKQKRLFSPKSHNHTLSENEREIDILVATDCISEGANLQDCDTLVNYDIAFNPITAVQRIGRIWRIGSKHEVVKVFHFLPSKADIDTYIDLESKLKYKMRAAKFTTPISSPFQEDNQDIKDFKAKRQKHYELLERDFSDIKLDSEENQFSSPQSILSKASSEILASEKFSPNPLPEGIFSIALEPNLPQNLLLIALKDQHQKSQLVLYDMSVNLFKSPLKEGADNASQSRIATLLESFKDYTKIERAEFEKFEKFTRHYSDLREFKRIFKRAVNAFNESLCDFLDSQAEKKTSDGAPPLLNQKFKLIAWMFINPNFNELGGEK